MPNAFFPENPNNVNKSRDDARSSLGACPLMKDTVQLVPLCYGLVDNPALDPAGKIAMPYNLTTRPLGIRLLRDGWLYVIESNGTLTEFRLLDGMLSAMLWQGKRVTRDVRDEPIKSPTLIVSKRSALHVTYSEVQWTAKKCHQVLDSKAERQHFMQAVNVSSANCQTGAPYLLTPDMAEHWLAEVASERIRAEQVAKEKAELQAYVEAENAQRRLNQEPELELGTPLPTLTVDAVPEYERLPYLWELPARFTELPMTALTACIDPHYRHDVLYLVVDDTLGVLRELAHYQDEAVGWIESWANGGQNKGDNERDYLLACYIESLSQLNAPDLSALGEASDDPRIKALFADLALLPEPDRGITSTAILQYVNKGGLMSPPAGSPTPPELVDLRKAAQDEAMHMVRYQGSTPDYTALGRNIGEADRRYYTREHFRVAPQGFVDTHFDALIALGLKQDSRMDDILYGAKFGQRGVNELIDREAMDSDLFAHRHGLKRWNNLLDRITADRVARVCCGAFHKAAWYFDAQNSAQVGMAFVLEYGCLKDICRSDDATHRLYEYTEQNPQFSRPLYYTLPHSEQTALWVQYAFLAAAGVGLLNNLSAYQGALAKIENGRLPALDQLPESTRAVADAAQQTMTPALNRGLEKTLADFDGVFKGQTMPDLDQLFRNLPKSLPARILDAAKREGVTFSIASEAEKNSLRESLQEVLKNRSEMTELKRARNRIKRTHGHTHPKAQALLGEVERVQQLLLLDEGRLAAGISPITELPDEHRRLYGSTPGRAGLTVIFPAAHRQEVAGLMRNFRKGIGSTTTTSKLGDGAALLLFVAQAVNLGQLAKEVLRQEKDERAWTPVLNAAAATGAAGFAAAQGVFDNALNARSLVLAEGLQNHAVRNLYVQMGKLHIGLGLLSYILGGYVAIKSLNVYCSSWVQAVQKGNKAAQLGAALSIVGASGLLGSNAYGAAQTSKALYSVLKASKGAARTAAWATSGARLTNIFFRANLAGALFTMLELIGTWVYNRYDLSAHDKWLQNTPWGADENKRQSFSLEQYQNRLVELTQAPFVSIEEKHYGVWWKDLVLTKKAGDVFLFLPGLTLLEFQSTLYGQVPRELKLGVGRITTVVYGKGYTVQKYQDISYLIEERLSRVSGEPLVLKLEYPESAEKVVGKVREELLVELEINGVNSSGVWVISGHKILLDSERSGVFSSAKHGNLKLPLKLLSIDLIGLESALNE